MITAQRTKSFGSQKTFARFLIRLLTLLREEPNALQLAASFGDSYQMGMFSASAGHAKREDHHGWLMFHSGKASLQTNPKRQRGRTLNSSRFAASPSLTLRVSFVGRSLSIEKLASRA